MKGDWNLSEQNDFFSTTKGTGSTWNETGKRCYHDHPPLKLKCTTGEEVTVFGGSCSYPVWDDCDIYVGLDYSMAEHPHRFPWNPGHAIHFKITDGAAPKSVKDFRRLIEFLAEELRLGRRVHVGCIGGHGRTGIVLAALTAVLTGESDPIGYVRTHYCPKAVESAEQVDFLVKHYNAKKVAGSKHSWGGKGKSGGGGKLKALTNGTSVDPIPADQTIWGSLKVERPTGKG